jgi:hypothetical protein
MARQSPDGYELTDSEKRDLIKLIIFFADTREVELVWNGKTAPAVIHSSSRFREQRVHAAQQFGSAFASYRREGQHLIGR